MLRISQSHLQVLFQEALETYPSECCGFLLGTEEKGVQHVKRLVVCTNEAINKRTNFLISANCYREAEQKADENGLCLLGVYHSHPNCAATPSELDSLAAFPYFSYLILSVSKDGATGVRCWKLNGQLLFEEEEIIIHQKTFRKKDITHGNHHHSYTSA